MTISAVTRQDFALVKNFDAAATRFGKKAALTSDVFERLSAAAKGQAFRVATVHKAGLIQRIRSVVERAIRDGRSWPDVRKEIVALLDSDGIPRPALSRLRTMFGNNVQQGYNDARRELLDDPEINVAFPFRQYLTVGNGTPGVRGVRPEHAALHGLIFKWDDPFWDSHTPPWDYGCRCTFVALTEGQVRRMRKPVRNLGYVRKKVKVKGAKRRGVAANPQFVRGGFDLSSIDRELREALQEMIE